MLSQAKMFIVLVVKQPPRKNSSPIFLLTDTIAPRLGEVAEWSNVPDSKSGVLSYSTVGSNPTLSASAQLLG